MEVLLYFFFYMKPGYKQWIVHKLYCPVNYISESNISRTLYYFHNYFTENKKRDIVYDHFETRFKIQQEVNP